MQRNWMLKIGVFYFTAIMSVGTFAQTMAHKTTDQSVDDFILQLSSAYEHRDLDAIAHFYDEHALVIGTGDDEILQGREQIVADFKRDFDQSLDSNITAEKIAIHVRGDVATAAYFLTVNVSLPNGTLFQSKLRFTAELLKEGHHWIILQSHLSAPLKDQQSGASFPNNEIK